MLFNDWAQHNVSDVADPIAVPLDGFVKTMYSSIMLDLGPQLDKSNALVSGKTIDYLLHRSKEPNYPYLTKNIPINTAYDFYKDSIAPLSEKPAQIYTQYVCSVPELRSGWALAVSIIVADLVLISAFWTALNWAATKWLSLKDDNWNHCPGCASSERVDCEANTTQYRALSLKDNSRDTVTSIGSIPKRRSTD